MAFRIASIAAFLSIILKLGEFVLNCSFQLLKFLLSSSFFFTTQQLFFLPSLFWSKAITFFYEGLLKITRVN